MSLNQCAGILAVITQSVFETVGLFKIMQKLLGG